MTLIRIVLESVVTLLELFKRIGKDLSSGAKWLWHHLPVRLTANLLGLRNWARRHWKLATGLLGTALLLVVGFVQPWSPQPSNRKISIGGLSMEVPRSWHDKHEPQRGFIVVSPSKGADLASAMLNPQEGWSALVEAIIADHEDSLIGIIVDDIESVPEDRVGAIRTFLGGDDSNPGTGNRVFVNSSARETVGDNLNSVYRGEMYPPRSTHRLVFDSFFMASEAHIAHLVLFGTERSFVKHLGLLERIVATVDA